MQQTEDAVDVSGFHFDALVRGLCNSTSMQAHLEDVRQHAQTKRYNARATLDNALQSIVKPATSLEDRTNKHARSVPACHGLHTFHVKLLVHLMVFVVLH